jgi:acyl-CoA reductase-like NAD-dependent aldehyde dehydrogenase
MSRQQSLYIAGQYASTSQNQVVGHAFSSELSQFRFSYVSASSPPEDLDLIEGALEAAHLTFRHSKKDATFFPVSERKAFLKRLSQKISDSKNNLSRLLTLEVAKPLRLSRIEIDRSQELIESYISQCDFVGESFEWEPTQFTVKNLTLKSVGFSHQPRGPLLAIVPFNFPVLLALHKILPSLVTGNPVIFKPSPKSVLISAALVDLAHAAELPPGMISLLNCSDDLVQKIANDSRIKQISFTGSSRVGWDIHSSVRKPVTLELGGAAPFYVSESLDTAALKRAAVQATSGALSFAGQACISTQNIFCHSSRYQEFKQMIVADFENFPCGDPLDEETLCAPVVEKRSEQRLHSFLERTKQEGLLQLTDNHKIDLPCFVSPNLIEVPLADFGFFSEELFGPIRGLVAWEGSISDWIEYINSQTHRLQAVLHSRNPVEISEFKKQTDFGSLVINGPSMRMDRLPFGGEGQAGLGCEGPLFAPKHLCLSKPVLEF